MAEELDPFVPLTCRVRKSTKENIERMVSLIVEHPKITVSKLAGSVIDQKFGVKTEEKKTINNQ